MSKMKEFPLIGEFVYFVNERWSIHQKRLKKMPAPWTDNPVLQKYRFCNVRREDDRVTRFIHEEWAKNLQDPDLWFAFYVSRVFNKPVTLDIIGWPVPWGGRSKGIEKRLIDIRTRGERVFNAAYIVSAPYSKIEYYCEIFNSLWHKRSDIRPTTSDTLMDFYGRLVQQKGIGSFMAAQVIADTKAYAPLKQAVDCKLFAASGPGSRRGLNWVCGRELYAPWRESDWRDTLLKLRAVTAPLLNVKLDAQNLQNCCCEFDKMCRTLYTNGRPKQLFKPGENLYE